jgi:hypothetical protein
MPSSAPRTFFVAALAAAFLGACSRTQVPDVPPVRQHHHHAPHGGTAVVLGDGEYHLELVLDPAEGSLQAYVMDDEMENFVRSASPSIEVEAKVAGKVVEVVLLAVPNPETGETVGDTALFEGRADGLRKAVTFEATIRGLTVRGKPLGEVTVGFPKGNDPDFSPGP